MVDLSKDPIYSGFLKIKKYYEKQKRNCMADIRYYDQEIAKYESWLTDWQKRADARVAEK